MPPYRFAEWATEQLRLTVFPVPGAADIPPEPWWHAIAGVPPDESTANLRMGLKTLAGAFHSGKLILKLEPQRIDWLFITRDLDPAEAPLGDFRVIGPIEETLELFSTVAERWLVRDDTPDLIRVAFGAIVNHPEEDRRSAYVRVPDYLPIQIDPESSDFNLQINVPTDSRTGIEGLRVNRLSKWSIMGLAHLSVRLEAGIVAATSSRLMAHAFRVELDINTSAEFRGILPRESRIDVYRELVALGRDILTRGLHQ